MSLVRVRAHRRRPPLGRRRVYDIRERGRYFAARQRLLRAITEAERDGLSRDATRLRRRLTLLAFDATDDVDVRELIAALIESASDGTLDELFQILTENATSEPR